MRGNCLLGVARRRECDSEEVLRLLEVSGTRSRERHESDVLTLKKVATKLQLVGTTNEPRRLVGQPDSPLERPRRRKHMRKVRYHISTRGSDSGEVLQSVVAKLSN